MVYARQRLRCESNIADGGSTYMDRCSSYKWRQLVNNTHTDHDVTVKIDQYSLSCHRLVLAVVSPFAESIFKNNEKELDLSNILFSKRSLKRFISYFYTGRIRLNDDVLTEILNCASYFLCFKLVFHCSQYLLERLSAQNCLHTWILAELYNLQHLSLVCRVFLRELSACQNENIDVSDIPEWFMEVMLKDLNTECCNNIYTLAPIIMNWLQYSGKRILVNKNLQKVRDMMEHSDVCPGFEREWFILNLVNVYKEPNLEIRCNMTNSVCNNLVIVIKEIGCDHLALFCSVSNSWTYLNAAKLPGTILGLIHKCYLVFFDEVVDRVFLYHIKLAQIFQITNLFPDDVFSFERYISRTFFVGRGKLYMAFANLLPKTDTVLLNIFEYKVSTYKWKLFMHVQVPGIWHLCNLHAVTTADNSIYIIMYSYNVGYCTERQTLENAFGRPYKGFLFCMDVVEHRLYMREEINFDAFGRPSYILNKKLYFLIKQNLLQNDQLPITWLASFQSNESDEILNFNVNLSSIPLLPIQSKNRKITYASHVYMSESSLVVAQHKGPSILSVFHFCFETRNVMVLPPVPIPAIQRNIRISTFYSSIPISCLLTKTWKRVPTSKCFFGGMCFDKNCLTK